jgi:organic hydroperoxide reductase OsmC/OhrA
VPVAPAEPSTHVAEVEWRPSGDDIRAHRVRLSDQELEGSCQPSLGGDEAKADPEQLFVSALATCHMLWFLDLARRRELRVAAYRDTPEGTMDGECFTRVVLRPSVEWGGDAPSAEVIDRLHARAHELCFIARSVACPVEVEPR